MRYALITPHWKEPAYGLALLRHCIHHTTPPQVVEWRQRLSAKDAEVERYKTELEAILAALEALKQAGGAGHT